MSGIIGLIHRSGLDMPGVRPEVSAVLSGLVSVEREHGTEKAVEATLSVFMTITATLGARHDGTAFDAAVLMLETAAGQLRNAKASLNAGRVPDGVVVKLGAPSGHREGRA
ncbi:hypothetical protein A6A40_17190 (plasmid) [Azospirillum humicireducens]|uniref:Uncharacterized protein n=1 Tax=Azospirillum humicireducens TaxID=1226968 RepID=A0A2R4VQS0_9PROT|nr:hypothetical protein [Azospirillum humicireducens]AWB06789.1 hypothetical protein A6A40_17190 [Azospirillum humicireducens]